MSSDADLARAAARAAASPGPLAAPLVAAWERAFPDGSAASALGADEGAVAALSLCARPRPTRWLADVEAIAAAARLDPARLIGFLRAAEAVERLRATADAGDAPADLLMAARDREEDE